MTEMGVIAAAGGADWIINNDADEFWWCETDLKEYLSGVPLDFDSIQCYWRTVIPCKEYPIYSDNPLVRTDDNFWKSMMRPHDNMSVSMGSHFILSSQRTGMVPGILVYHFQDRNPQALYNKYVVGREALARAGLADNIGKHWHAGHRIITSTSFEAFTAGKYLSRDTLLARENIGEEYTMVNLLKSIPQRFVI